MKPTFFLLLAGLACGPGSAARAGAAPFDFVGSDYKKPQEVPDTFFNPFKVQSLAGTSFQKKAGATVTNDLIVEAVGHRIVSGVVYALPGTTSRVIIGDQVFAIGDELVFPDGDPGGSAPLVPGAVVVLREVGAGDLAFDVTPEGEATRRINFPLRAFWHR